MKFDYQSNLTRRGFTLIELMLAIMAFLLLFSVVMISFNNQKTYRRDLLRLANIDQLEKAFEIYVSETSAYPIGRTCLNGQDHVSQALLEHKIFEPGMIIGDPEWADNPEYCYLYKGTASSYALRFYLETDKTEKGEKGYNIIHP